LKAACQIDLWQSTGGIIAAAEKTGKVDADAVTRMKRLAPPPAVGDELRWRQT